VLAREHPNGERMLVAYLVAKDGAPLPTSDELRRFAAERLPQSMVPATFTFIDAIPLTPNGKLDSRALPAPRWMVEEKELVPPRTPVEESIAAIWAEVLGVERVGVTQDFFEVGGDSIRSIQIVARCKRAGIHIRPSDLFQHPTVAALAAVADAAPRPEQVAPAAFDIHPELLDLALAQVEFDE
jgi:aryl carrier-like protein